jgi:hypothetical protein
VHPRIARWSCPEGPARLLARLRPRLAALVRLAAIGPNHRRQDRNAGRWRVGRWRSSGRHDCRCATAGPRPRSGDLGASPRATLRCPTRCARRLDGRRWVPGDHAPKLIEGERPTQSPQTVGLGTLDECQPTAVLECHARHRRGSSGTPGGDDQVRASLLSPRSRETREGSLSRRKAVGRHEAVRLGTASGALECAAHGRLAQLVRAHA